MQQWQIAGLNKLESSGYLDTLRNLVQSHTSPFWWYDDKAETAEAILHNGTVTFVNTGSRVLAISALHVYEQYLEDKAAVESIRCQFGSITVDPERYMIADNSALDMVTFELPLVLATATGATIHNAGSWPPPKLQEADLVILGGYPGNRRSERKGSADFDFVSLISRVSQSSEDHVSVYLNMPESHWPQGKSIGSAPDLGGISGGPVFLIRTAPIETIEFAGMVYQASQEYEIVYARHASQVCPQGLIR